MLCFVTLCHHHDLLLRRPSPGPAAAVARPLPVVAPGLAPLPAAAGLRGGVDHQGKGDEDDGDEGQESASHGGCGWAGDEEPNGCIGDAKSSIYVPIGGSSCTISV